MYFQRGESLLKFLRFYIKTYLNRYSHERTIMVKYERFKVYICIKADWSISRNIQLILSWHVKLSLEMGNVFFLLFTIDIISVKDGHSRNHNKNNIFSKLKEFIIMHSWYHIEGTAVTRTWHSVIGVLLICLFVFAENE